MSVIHTDFPAPGLKTARPCPYCQAEGKDCLLYIHSMSSTLLFCPAYYDEEGVLVIPDCNTHTTSYACSDGHSIIESQKGRSVELRADTTYRYL